MMSNKNVITVVGSNMVDLSSFLNRFPERGETLFGKDFVQGYGGKGANQAIMASILGAKVSMVTCVGDDVYGPGWIKEFEKNNVNTEYVKKIEDNYSGVASIWVEEEGDNRIVLGAGANNDVDKDLVNEAFDKLPNPNVVLSQLEIPQEAILEGFKRGKQVGAKNILNPGPAAPVLKEIMEITDWILPNETEFAILANEMYGMNVGEFSIESYKVAIKEFAIISKTNVVITMGEDGSMLYMPNENMEVKHLKAPTVEAVDTTGAGDAFCGAFTYGISTGLEPSEAVKLANILASESVKGRGTQISYARGKKLDEIIVDFVNNK